MVDRRRGSFTRSYGGERSSPGGLLSRRIRVLFVNHTAKLGGGEIALRLLIHHLDRTRIDHEVLLFEDGPLTALLRQGSAVHIVQLPAGIRDARKDSLLSVSTLKKVGGIPLSIWRVRSAIRKLKIDFVHTNSLKADLVGGIAARLAGKPVIWHIRDRIAPDYLPAKVVAVFRALARLVPVAIIANSRATLESLNLPAAATRSGGTAHVVHDGVDLSMIPVKPIPMRTSLVVGLVGRISPWKGQDVFLRAIQQIRQEVPDVRFEIIGSALFGEEQYERELQDLATQLELDDSVQFCGFVTNIAERIAALDLVVHASTISEPFGQVVIEGMAAGKAVVATRGGGVSEIVEDGVSGLLVAMKDPTALAQAMLLLLKDPVRRAQLGKAARRRVEDKFQIQFTAQKVLRLYQDLAQSQLS